MSGKINLLEVNVIEVVDLQGNVLRRIDLHRVDTIRCQPDERFRFVYEIAHSDEEGEP